MSFKQDLGCWEFVQGEPLAIGHLVRFPHDSEFKQDWPDEYYVTGVSNYNDSVDITLSDNLDGTGGSGDGFTVGDLILIPKPKSRNELDFSDLDDLVLQLSERLSSIADPEMRDLIRRAIAAIPKSDNAPQPSPKP